ncbi:MAG: hypothetical protein ACJA1Z_001829 [Patiriisocius sp.]
MRGTLKTWCDYLDSKSSLDVVMNNPNFGWLSPASVTANNLNTFVTAADKEKDSMH